MVSKNEVRNYHLTAKQKLTSWILLVEVWHKVDRSNNCKHTSAVEMSLLVQSILDADKSFELT